MKKRVFEFLGVIALVAVVILLVFPRKKPDEERRNETKTPGSSASPSKQVDFHWSTQGDGYEYYFEVRDEEWAGLLCSQNPMGNYYAQGKLEGNGKAQAQETLRKLLERHGGEGPDFGLAYPYQNWYLTPRSGLIHSPTWGKEGFKESFVPYQGLMADRSLVMFFQVMTTNGGYRTDFHLRKSPNGGYQYSLTVPEIDSAFAATGQVTSQEWQALSAAIQNDLNFGKARIQTGGGHDCTYYTLLLRDTSPPQYYQWYESSAGQNAPQAKLLNALLSWKPFRNGQSKSIEFMDKKYDVYAPQKSK